MGCEIRENQYRARGIPPIRRRPSGYVSDMASVAAPTPGESRYDDLARSPGPAPVSPDTTRSVVDSTVGLEAEHRQISVLLCDLVNWTSLSRQLDGEDPDWRDNTILVLDGAAYHRGTEARKALAALRIPTMIAGPYGYDAAPAEKLFALLKVGDLNPFCIKTGKK